MFELGQPLHGYDLATVVGGLGVRRATPGETLTTLDDVTRTLDPEDLVITDDQGPVGLAGVMGGARTEISATTTDVLIEAAGFDQVSIARTARRHKLPSEASKRFERGVDPLVAEAAANRAVAAPRRARRRHGRHPRLDAGRHPRAPRRAHAPVRPSELIGVEYSDAEVVDTLARHRCRGRGRDGEQLAVTPPTWRPDLTDDTTLVEEVARIVGYDRIPSVLPVAPPGRGLTAHQQALRRVAAALAADGLTEVVTAPFVSRRDAAAYPGIDADGRAGRRARERARQRAEPAPPQRSARRSSRSLVATCRAGSSTWRVYETSRVFLPCPTPSSAPTEVPVGAAHPDAETLAALDAALPAQPFHVSALLAGTAS